MPSIGELINQISPLAGGFVAQGPGAAKVQTPEGGVSVGKGGLYGPQNVGKHLYDYLQIRQLERNMGNVSSAVEEFKRNLAYQFGKNYLKLSDEDARMASVRLSVPTAAASAALMQMGVPKILERIENGMNSFGVSSNMLSDGQSYRDNEFLQNMGQAVVRNILDESYRLRGGAVNGIQLADVVMGRIEGGDANYLLRSGVSPDHIVQMYSRAGESAARITGKTPEEGLEILNGIYGRGFLERSPVHAVNALQNLAAYRDASGMSPQTVVAVLQKTVQEDPDAARNPLNALSRSVAAVAAVAGSRRLAPESAEETPAAVLQLIQKKLSGEKAKAYAGLFGMLTEAGLSDAEAANAVRNTALRTSNLQRSMYWGGHRNKPLRFKDAFAQSLQDLNNSIPSRFRVKDPSDVALYADTKGADRFRQSGVLNSILLNDRTGYETVVNESMKKVLGKYYTPQMLAEIRNGGFSPQAVDSVLDRFFRQAGLPDADMRRTKNRVYKELSRYGTSPVTEQQLARIISDPVHNEAAGRMRAEEALRGAGKSNILDTIVGGRTGFNELARGLTGNSSVTSQQAASALGIPERSLVQELKG